MLASSLHGNNSNFGNSFCMSVRLRTFVFKQSTSADFSHKMCLSVDIEHMTESLYHLISEMSCIFQEQFCCAGMLHYIIYHLKIRPMLSIVFI